MGGTIVVRSLPRRSEDNTQHSLISLHQLLNRIYERVAALIDCEQ